MLRAVICDDEELSLDRLNCLLPRLCDVTVVATARDGLAALDSINQARPDVVLLDIEMPGLDGFDVVEHLAWDRLSAPLIIFVSAYPAFAAQAFEAGAIDFLTKPVRRARLEIAIDRVNRAIADRSAAARLELLAAQLDALRRAYGEQSDCTGHVWVKRRDGRVRLELEQVERVDAEGEYVRLHYPGGSYLHRDSITAIEERLDPRRFVRIHRSTIIRRADVVGVTRRATGSYYVTTSAGAQLPVGRSYRRIARGLTAPA
ncbi:MAG: DNA-binding response regulator [Alphaproteobacteria bacterium]|nr:DNA-binding response regulator [Alphaproteobacteria bacterium]